MGASIRGVGQGEAGHGLILDSTSRSRSLRIGAVDDEPVLLRGVLSVLEDRCQFVVTAHTVEALLATGATFDVVILDVRLADGSQPWVNVAALREVGVPVLLYTKEIRNSWMARCLSAGAAGVVAKNDPIDVLVAAIDEVANGGAHLNAHWAHVLGNPALWQSAPPLCVNIR